MESLLFDNNLFRMFFYKNSGVNYWNNFIESLLNGFAPDFEKRQGQRVIQSQILFLEYIGVSVKSILKDLECYLRKERKLIDFGIEKYDPANHITDTIIKKSVDFLENYPSLSFSSLNKKKNEVVKRHFLSYERVAKFNEYLVFDVLKILEKKEFLSALKNEIALLACARFYSTHQPQHFGPKEKQEQREDAIASLSKEWAYYVNKNENWSFYSVVDELHQMWKNKGYLKNFPNYESLKKYKDLGDGEIIHHAVFGVFLEGDDEKKDLVSVSAFTCDPNIDILFDRVRVYKTYLVSFKSGMGLQVDPEFGYLYQCSKDSGRVIARICVKNEKVERLT